jgi:ferrous iron transport protein B
MNAETVRTLPRFALAGNPNCGKTALFNAITGGRQKVGNYPGVTVEKKEGSVTRPSGDILRILDLPGTYSLDAKTPDEEITRDVLLGTLAGEDSPSAILAVADATSLERNLGLVLELRELGLPIVLALNMMDLAKARGADIDLNVLSAELGMPVVPTVAVKGEGIDALLESAVAMAKSRPAVSVKNAWLSPSGADVRARFSRVDAILAKAVRRSPSLLVWSEKLDRVVVHPVWGTLILFAILATVFQAIFTWASLPADLIESGIAALGDGVGGALAEGPLRSLLVEGVIAGVGSVLVFLPQILLLFFFILLLEDSGYMARAAFLMDRVMGNVGLHGRAFIPMLSSYACAIPGIMATRTIENRRDRLTTILVVPLTTCSARLPVYTLLIAAFIPNTTVWGPFRLQGLVMFGLYLGGLLAALGMAWIFKRTILKGAKPPLLMELPTYKIPSWRNVLFGLRERAWVFLRRAGTVILTITILLWFVASYPKAPEGATEPPINYSYAGRLGHAIEPLIRPLGFDWRIGIAFVPGFAAREVMVSALATVYAIEGKDEEASTAALSDVLKSQWSVATALSLMVWYILACQCLSTLAVTRRETNSWRWPIFMLVYMTALAYLGSFATYHVARWAGLG